MILIEYGHLPTARLEIRMEEELLPESRMEAIIKIA